jgi:protease I
MKYLIFLYISILVTCGGGSEEIQTEEPLENPRLAGSILMVIAPHDFRDEEFKKPYDLFTNSGISVTIASTDTLKAKGMLGMEVKPDISFEQVIPDSFDGLVVVGGTGCRALWDNKKLHEIILAFNSDNKIVAAICIAPVVLAHAGILTDMQVTGSPSVKDEINECGACYVESDVQVCDNIITGKGPKAAQDFAETVIQSMGK